MTKIIEVTMTVAVDDGAYWPPVEQRDPWPRDVQSTTGSVLDHISDSFKAVHGAHVLDMSAGVVDIVDEVHSAT